MLQNIERRIQPLVFSRFLRYFCAVAKLGSIRKASEQLHVSASSIDRQILIVEEELEIPLFERLPTGLRLTAAGELLLHSALNWQKDFERVKVQMDDLRGLRRGHVQIAVIEALSKGFVTDMVCAIRQEFPGISFTLNVLDNTNVAQALVSGAADFGIMLNPKLSKDIAVRKSIDIDVGIVTAPDHALAQHQNIRFNKCIGYPLVLPCEPLALTKQVNDLVSAVRTNLDIVASSDNVQMIKSLVGQGLGISVLGWLDVINEVNAGELAFTKLTDPGINPFTLSLCVASSRQLSLAAGLLLNRLETSFSGLQRNA